MIKPRFGRRKNARASSSKSFPKDRRTRAERRRCERRKAQVPVAVDRRRADRRRRGAILKLVSTNGRPFVGDSSEGVPVYHCRQRFGPPERIAKYREKVRARVLDIIDLSEFGGLTAQASREQVSEAIDAVLAQGRVPLSAAEQRALAALLLDDILGFGPLEPLLADPSVSDILVNGPDKVWVERHGRIEITDVAFRSNKHLMNVIKRIVTRANRRIDETNPMVDARLPDGSRVNVIIPPLSYRFPAISIRKFIARTMTLDDMAEANAMSHEMAGFLRIAAKYRLNILISGGTGTGKTTLLNALSRHIGPRERIVTIEDTAELQLHQPNVVSLETRLPNIENTGTVNIGDLLINALRMRPDRILVGEVRGGEAADMLQAMNTGHDGSIGTIHANNPRDAMLRFENMICMNDRYAPGKVTRQQIKSALDIVVHMSRMQDGVRRVTCISEVVGIEDEIILTQDLYRFNVTEETATGEVVGVFERKALAPAFRQKLKHYRLTPEEKKILGQMPEVA